MDENKNDSQMFKAIGGAAYLLASPMCYFLAIECIELKPFAIGYYSMYLAFFFLLQGIFCFLKGVQHLKRLK